MKTSKIAQPMPLPIGSLLHHLARRIETETSEALCDINLPLREFSLLIRLSVHPGLCQRDYAEQLAVDVSTFSRMVDRLVHQGLLERRNMPVDRRSKSLRLLPAGQDRLAAGYVHVAAVERRVLAPLPPDQQQTFRTMLGLLSPPQDG